MLLFCFCYVYVMLLVYFCYAYVVLVLLFYYASVILPPKQNFNPSFLCYVVHMVLQIST